MSARRTTGAAFAAASFAGASLFLALISVLASERFTPASAQEAPRARIELRSQKITLPFGDRQFPGSGKWAEIANGRCLLCHSRAMINTQPPMPLAVWKSEIVKMRGAYGCVVDDAEISGLAQFFYELNHERRAADGQSSTQRGKDLSGAR